MDDFALRFFIQMVDSNLKSAYELRDSCTENLDIATQTRLTEETAHAAKLYTTMADQFGHMSEELTAKCLEILEIMFGIVDKFVTLDSDTSKRIKQTYGEIVETAANSHIFYKCLLVCNSKDVDAVRSELAYLETLTSLSEVMSETVSNAIKVGKLRLAGVETSVVVHEYLKPEQPAQNFRMN